MILRTSFDDGLLMPWELARIRSVGPCAAALAERRQKHKLAVRHLNSLETALFFGHRAQRS
jgi:hypothetical protein